MGTVAAVDPDLLDSTLRADLTAALRARDQVRVRALRSALSAIANAEAPPAPATNSSAEPEIGRLVEHARRQLSTDDLRRILQGEIEERDRAASDYQGLGRVDEADRMTAEAEVLRGYLAVDPTA